jgi:hypothetical protein
MAPDKKPAFLKTFSEFTTDELRRMPFLHVLSLFFQEVSTTFTSRRVEIKVTKGSVAKKNTEKSFLTAKKKTKAAFSFPKLTFPKVTLHLQLPKIRIPKLHLKIPTLPKPSLRLRVPKISHPHFKKPVLHKPNFKINTVGFTEAMKRVFTPGPVTLYEAGQKKTPGVEKKNETETVVFSNP